LKLRNLFAIVVLFLLVLAAVPASMVAQATPTPPMKVLDEPVQLSGQAPGAPRPAGASACTVLLVDDDWDFDQTVPNDGGRPYYTSALDALGVAYGVWDTVTQGEPATADMQSYDVVIWFTGYAFSGGVFTTDNETQVAAYLDGGGNLILSSEDYHYEAGAITPFMANYLGVASVTDDVIKLDPVGNAGNPIGSGLGPYAMIRPDDYAVYWPTGTQAGPFDDYVTAAAGADEPFRFNASGQNNSTNKAGAGWKTVFLAWPLEWIDTVPQRAEILDQVLDWICAAGVPRVRLLPPIQQGSAEPGSTAFYLVDIENLLGYGETFDLTYDSVWPATVPAQIGPVASGGWDQFLVQVAVPSDAQCNRHDLLTVTASDPSGTYRDTAQIQTFAAGDWDTTPNYGASAAHWMAFACTDVYGTSGTCFYAGGLVAGDTVTGVAQKYDIGTQTWTTIASLPTPVFGAVGGYIGGRFCVAGGFTTTAGDWGGTYATQCYNPGTNGWAAAAAIPGGGAGGAGGAAGGVTGGMLHVVAGCGANNCTSNQHYAFDGTSWTQLAAAPATLIFPGAAVGQGKLFVGGGYDGASGFYEYDAGTNAWLSRASLPGGAGRKSPVGAVVPGGGAFWWGGDLGAGSSVQDTTWYYDPNLDHWVQFPATLAQATTGAGGGMANNALWSFGGTTGAGPISPPPHEFLEGWCVPENYRLYLPIVARIY
jgi:hypothetical protein